MDDLELMFREITGWDMAGDLVVTHEETMETAIPEYCPDLARIVDSVGQVRVREKSLVDGKLTISGGIRVTVLYTSEESAGLRSLALTLPFSCKVDDKRDCQMITVDSRLLLLEVKMLGARKLYVRALPEFRVHCYHSKRFRICVAAEGDTDLQILRKQAVLPLLTDIWEREFNFAQEIPPENGQDEAEDLLLDRTFLRITDCQHFGNKLVIKGEAMLSLLCRGESQRIHSRELTLPFSQIIDGDDLPENGEFSCAAQVMEHEIHPVRTENGNGFGVTIRICLMIHTFEEYAIDYVADLYSTRYEILSRTETASFPSANQSEEMRRDVTQRLDGAGAFVYLTDADCTQPDLTTSEGDQPVLRSTIHMKVLYLDESGAPVIAERTTEVNGETGQLPSAVQIFVERESWQRVGSGYEVRIPVQFRLYHTGLSEISSLASAQVQGEVDRSSTPSLVLRRLGKGESLWDLAKQCRTEAQAILAANGLDQESDISDQMLLIPKIR